MLIHPAQRTRQDEKPPALRPRDLVRSGPWGIDADRWSAPISFFVAGTPIPQPRPRARAIPGNHGSRCRCGRRWTAQLYDPLKDETDGEGRVLVRSAEPWKQLVTLIGRSVQPARPLSGTLAVALDFYFAAPEYVRDWATRGKIALPVLMPRRPDFDNLDKAVTDAMTDAGWWWDDGQLAFPLTPKWWIAPDQSEGVHVQVWSLKPESSQELF